MARTKLSAATAVTYGYGQVEPNHLSAQRTGQIYAQLPAAQAIEKLENGQFVKYDYMNGEVNFTGAGEWMLVYNEVKVYRDYEGDADFAMLKDNYNARVYSPVDGASFEEIDGADWTSEIAPADPYIIDSTSTPSKNLKYTTPFLMKEGTTMVPRVFKTNIGDIFTTNTINTAIASLALGDVLTVGADGILVVNEAPAATDMQWQVVKIYNLGDRQPAAKLMRIA